VTPVGNYLTANRRAFAMLAARLYARLFLYESVSLLSAHGTFRFARLCPRNNRSKARNDTYFSLEALRILATSIPRNNGVIRLFQPLSII
jgi:hypothetical protein